MSIHPIDIAINVVNIVVLYVLLRIILYNPVQKFLQQRQDGIAKKLKDADDLKAEADQLRAQFDKRMSEADQVVQQKMIDGSKKAGEQAETILKSAKDQAQELLDKAQAQVAQQRADAIAQLQSQISDMAVSLAGEILKREVKASDNQKVIESFFEKEVHRQ